MKVSDSDEALREIIEQAKQGDTTAFSYLYTEYFTPLYRYIYFRMGGQKSDAEDLTQDVFIKAYMSFSRYTYSGTTPLAYFYTIARNSIIDHRRKKKMLIMEEDALLAIADDADGPQQFAIKIADAQIVHKNIALLPEDQQDVIVLRFIEGRSTKEIAALLDKSEDSIRQLQSRGLKLLRKNITSL